jgi:ATP-dependent DNA ligase
LSLLLRDEGIVVKDLSSKWEPSDRSGKWLKLKPDYVQAGSDLDVLIIGSYDLSLKVYVHLGVVCLT